MRQLIRSRLIWISTVCKCVSAIYLMSEFTRLYPIHSKFQTIQQLEIGISNYRKTAKFVEICMSQGEILSTCDTLM